MDFKDKVVIVTGSSSGIGAATALHFAKHSAKVVIVGRNEERLKKVANEVEETKGIKPLVIKADLGVDSDVLKIIEETVKHFGKIDVLVNNAGVGSLAGVRDGVKHFDNLVSINLRSVYLIIGLAAPHLIKSKGNIVNVSSIAAAKVVHEFTPYCISKAGLDMLTKCVAKDLAPEGVRVNSVNPGPVKTNFHASASFDQRQIEEYFEARFKRSPTGKITTCEEVADLILYLSSDRAGSITGNITFIENGDMLV